jgi:hypothetical protein
MIAVPTCSDHVVLAAVQAAIVMRAVSLIPTHIRPIMAAPRLIVPHVLPVGATISLIMTHVRPIMGATRLVVPHVLPVGTAIGLIAAEILTIVTAARFVAVQVLPVLPALAKVAIESAAVVVAFGIGLIERLAVAAHRSIVRLECSAIPRDGRCVTAALVTAQLAHILSALSFGRIEVAAVLPYGGVVLAQRLPVPGDVLTVLAQGFAIPCYHLIVPAQIPAIVSKVAVVLAQVLPARRCIAGIAPVVTTVPRQAPRVRRAAFTRAGRGRRSRCRRPGGHSGVLGKGARRQ